MQDSVFLHFSPGRGYCIVLRSICFFLGSMLSNDIAQKPSPMKMGAGAGTAKGVLCRRWALVPTVFSVMFWRPPSLLSCTRDEPRQTDGKGRLSSEAAFNFHKDDFVS